MSSQYHQAPSLTGSGRHRQQPQRRVTFCLHISILKTFPSDSSINLLWIGSTLAKTDPRIRENPEVNRTQIAALYGINQYRPPHVTTSKLIKARSGPVLQGEETEGRWRKNSNQIRRYCTFPRPSIHDSFHENLINFRIDCIASKYCTTWVIHRKLSLCASQMWVPDFVPRRREMKVLRDVASGKSSPTPGEMIRIAIYWRVFNMRSTKTINGYCFCKAAQGSISLSSCYRTSPLRMLIEVRLDFHPICYAKIRLRRRSFKEMAFVAAYWWDTSLVLPNTAAFRRRQSQRRFNRRIIGEFER